mmetsp:Transcript_38536/g.85793  ORF Transcript_38536/g.85793 Transcript_38536/m.85793 type:complete len:102 (+) Transcript_38536:798-1103(+)
MPRVTMHGQTVMTLIRSTRQQHYHGRDPAASFLTCLTLSSGHAMQMKMSAHRAALDTYSHTWGCCYAKGLIVANAEVEHGSGNTTTQQQLPPAHLSCDSVG